MLAIGIVVGVLVLGALALDEGEIVSLSTEEGGRFYSTQLWIVEVDGREFVRANRPSARWLARLRANPAVGLRRSGAAHGPSEPYWAEPTDDPALRARVDAEISSKYRFADRTWGRFADRAKAQLVELKPRTASPSDLDGASPAPAPSAEGDAHRVSGASS